MVAAFVVSSCLVRFDFLTDRSLFLLFYVSFYEPMLCRGLKAAVKMKKNSSEEKSKNIYARARMASS